MIRAALLLFAVSPLFGQTAAALLARLDGVRWEGPPTAACTPRIPVQLDIYATVEWTHHCADTRDGVIRESFFYVFGEPARIARLRVDLLPVDESPENTARLLPALQRTLTARFGPPAHEPELREIGFYHLRYGQPIVGDHWMGGGLHYFLHANLSGGYPMTIRRGVQLVVITDRLFAERAQDALILRAEGFSGEAHEDDNPVRARLKARMLVNLCSGYQWKLVEGASMRLDAGIDNLGNRKYDLPLGGRYWIGDKTGNSSVPGMGRSIYGGLTFQF